MPKEKKEAVLKGAIAELSKLGFTIKVPKATITLSYGPSLGKEHQPTTLQCAVELIASATVNADPPKASLSIQAHDGNFTSLNPPNPTIDSIINGAVLPLVVNTLNTVGGGR